MIASRIRTSPRYGCLWEKGRVVRHWLVVVGVFASMLPYFSSPSVVAASSRAYASTSDAPSVCEPSFADSASMPVGDNPCRLAAGDIDQDGHVDILTGNCSTVDLS